ncbi:flagellar hook-associated protein FlgK [Alphaproteobacteria bacterium]|nr:flagellar hook-associated protein FlgK [Alphaproteobacteria bacterium]
MTSLFDVGKSALQAYRQSLAVTGQNIANINTEGYMRREAELQEVTASQGGITSIANQSGLGVRVADVRRSFDTFLADRKLAANSNFQRMDSYVRQLEKVEDLLLPSDADLGIQIGNFFRALSDVSSAPSDLAPRVVALEKGESLAAAFNSTALQLNQLSRATVGRMDDAITGLNIITQELASVNERVLSASQSGKSPNAVLDLRDKLVEDLSKLIDISVEYTDRGVANVTIGKSGVGPSLVKAGDRTTLGFVEKYDKNGGLQVILNPNASRTPTSQMSSGVLSGLSDAHAMINSVIEDIDGLASQMAADLNRQHRLGMTLDGLKGQDIFSSRSIVSEASPTNPVGLDAELIVTDSALLPKNKLTVTFDTTANNWQMSGSDLAAPVTGSSVLQGPGFELRLSGPATTGSSFTLVPSENAAANLKFLLSRPHDIAAASPDLVTSANTNESDATLDARRIVPTSYPENAKVAEVFSNSMSAVDSREFRSDGLLAEIPAGVSSVDLASLTRQGTAKFQLTDLALQNLTQLTFGRTSSSDDGPHTFNVSYATAFPNDTSGIKWTDSVQVADLLNKGVLRSSANKSLADLGMRASGSGGSITLTTASGDFETSGANLPMISTGAGTISAIVSTSVAASDLHIFTREGRHIAGVAFTDAQITEFMNAQNGFDDSAVYSAGYLNDFDNPYRGIDMDVNFVGGMYEITTGSNGVGSVLASGNKIVPANPTSAHNFTVAVNGGVTKTIAVEKGASARQTATQMNATLKNVGIRADANTRVELFDFASDGIVTFDLEAANRIPLEVSADVTTTNLSNLAIAINKLSDQSGVTAVTSADLSRIYLTSDAGEDIAISKFGASSPNFFGRLVNDNQVAKSTPIGTVTASGDFKDALAATQVVSNTLVAGANVSTTTASGSSADMSLSRDSSGAYTATITAGGSGYAVGETFTISGTLVGGTSPAHDTTMTVSAVNGSGAITGVTVAGATPGLTQAQSTITPTTTSGLGTGASFDVTMTDGVPTIVVNNAGNGYRPNDTITILGSALGGTDGVNDMTLSVATLAASSMVSFGSGTGASRIDTARFVGDISLVSSAAFSTTAFSNTTNAARDSAIGNIANVVTNGAGNSKTVSFDVSPSLESGGSSLNGQRAVSPDATYGISIPTSSSAIAFTASLDAANLDEVSNASINKALIKSIRDQAPLASISAGTPAAVAQVASYSFARTEAVVPADDSVSLKINGTTINVDLNDIDGLGTVASTDQDVTTAIITAVNAADLGITATSSGTPPQYGVTLTADKVGVPFTVEAFSFNDLNEIVAQPDFGLAGETVARALPADGTTVSIDFGAQTYQLSMVDGEVVVSGAEAGRVTAYFDANNRLQIFGGGTLSGETFAVTSDAKVGDNSTAAASFGLDSSTTRLTGQEITLSATLDSLNVTFNAANVAVSVDSLGAVSTQPSSVSGLTLRWESASATTGRLVAEFDASAHTLSIDSPSDALGFKVADRQIALLNDDIIVKSTDNSAFEMTATATSISGSRFTLNNIPHEDLLVFSTGAGARNIAAEFADPAEFEDLTTYEIRATGSEGNTIEIWDADTGHSIATRVVSGDRQTSYGNFEFTLNGRVADGDKFTLEQDAAGVSDGRNLDRLIALQNGNETNPNKNGFQEIFGATIAGIGSTVQSTKIAVDVQEESLMAAREAEAEFSGVSLDSEAAALIEFQQAYQASARILSTARELFQSLMEVV